VVKLVYTEPLEWKARRAPRIALASRGIAGALVRLLVVSFRDDRWESVPL
jgi:hypothetical protein